MYYIIITYACIVIKQKIIGEIVKQLQLINYLFVSIDFCANTSHRYTRIETRTRKGSEYFVDAFCLEIPVGSEPNI